MLRVDKFGHLNGILYSNEENEPSHTWKAEMHPTTFKVNNSFRWIPNLALPSPNIQLQLWVLVRIFNFNNCSWVWGHTLWCSPLIPGSVLIAWGPICSASDWTHTGCVQGKHIYLCTISSAVQLWSFQNFLEFFKNITTFHFLQLIFKINQQNLMNYRF